MLRPILALGFLLGIAPPAHATGGLGCRTAGPQPIEISMGFGHVPGSPLILTRLIDDGRPVPVASAQWWLDDAELRLLLTSPSADREELLLRARRKEFHYDGTIRRNGKRRWIRCRED